jgi:hypothetical protein
VEPLRGCVRNGLRELTIDLAHLAHHQPGRLFLEFDVRDEVEFLEWQSFLADVTELAAYTEAAGKTSTRASNRRTTDGPKPII